MRLSNRAAYIIAISLLLLMFVLALTSIKNDSLTMDELAHLPAGYSYLTQKDMRLNPEHPPLIKDISAVPLLFISEIKFPSDIKSWKEDVNGQWDFGSYFLYQAGNPADKIIFWGRFPMLFILILLGFFIFKWSKELFGNATALLALFFFSFSPTFLAHGRLVTTDVGAATGAFIAAYYFIRSLKNPSLKNIVIAGIAFGLAELLKFSLILLIPLYFVLAIFWFLINNPSGKNFLIAIKNLFLTGIIGLLVIWPVYQYHTWNYPSEKQAKDAEVYLSSYPKFISQPIIWSAEKPILRPYAQYLTGLFMVFNRATGGNTTYFWGEVSNHGWKKYFPTIYAIKEPLTFLLLSISALLYAGWLLVKKSFKPGSWLKNHFSEFSMLVFIVIYWATSLTSNLNIGVRHLLPVFPFTMVLVSAVTVKWLGDPLKKMKYGILLFLISWQMVSVFSIYPHFLAYFNELVGGPDKGYLYAVDSNLDWGQDLKRLVNWVNENNINKIYVSYFGGGNPEYYLKEKYAPWWGDKNPEELPKGSYLAVSATLLQGGRGTPAKGFNQPTSYYRWLDKYQPVAKIGYSIFIYHIK